MAWVDCEVVVSGDTVKGGINSRDDDVRVEIPFVKGVSAGDQISVDGATYKVLSVVNVGDRDEQLSMEVSNGKPVSRRTRGKAGGQDVQDEDDG